MPKEFEAVNVKDIAKYQSQSWNAFSENIPSFQLSAMCGCNLGFLTCKFKMIWNFVFFNHGGLWKLQAL